MITTSNPPFEELSEHELAAEAALPLPARQAMSTIRLTPGSHIAMPINEALALNHDSTDSVAFADAGQTVITGPFEAQHDPTTPTGAQGG